MATTCPALALADSDRPSADKPASENRPLDLPLAASTSFEDKQPVHSREHNQPEEPLALDNRKAEEPEAGLDDCCRRTYSGYPSDARCESSGEYLDEQCVVEQRIQVPTVAEMNHEPNQDSLVPEVPKPSLAELRPSSAFHNPSRPLLVVDSHPSSGRHRHSNLDQLPSWEQPSQASLRLVPFLHIRRYIPWPERPSLEQAACIAVQPALASAEADTPSSAGTAIRRDPTHVEKSPALELGETIPEADKPEHKEHTAA
jgi:hypothetical protein